MSQAQAVLNNTQEANDDIIVDYSRCPLSRNIIFITFVLAFIAGGAALYLFYHNIVPSIIGGCIVSPLVVRMVKKNAVKKRMLKLRIQFRDMLEAMSVSMRAGSNEVMALQSAYSDLLLIYPQEADIIREVKNMLALYESGLPLREVFQSFAQRSALEDVQSFASVFEAIEGKSDRSSEIMRQTQKVIADKIEIEAEIETMITSTKSEQNIMFCMPLVIVAAMGFMGDGFMDVIYTTAVGRIVATATIIIFVVAFMISNKITNFKV
ncbi:MAG: hypothetical protein RR234_02050 [Christensenella sp.]